MITAKEKVEPGHAGSSYEALRRPHIVKLYTIGFTKKSAEKFFDLLKQNEVQLMVDIRLHPNSQLAGFAKQNDLAYFLPRLADCDYICMSELTAGRIETRREVQREDKGMLCMHYTMQSLLRN